MIDFDPQTVSEVIRQAAKEIILPFRRDGVQALSISRKSGGEIVTQADKKCEEFLSLELKKIIPTSHIVGEESASENPDVFVNLKGRDLVWVIDPIDGTRNYYNGVGRYATLVALVKDECAVAGWIYEPHSDTLARAVVEQGAYLNGRKVTVKPDEKSPEEMTGYLNPKVFVENLQSLIEENIGAFDQTRSLHCIGCEYLDLVRPDVAIDFAAFPRSRLWDHLAGALILNEAGGVAQTATQRPISGEVIYHKNQWIIAARSQIAWEIARRTLFEGIDWHSHCI